MDLLSLPSISFHPDAGEYFWFHLPEAIPALLTVLAALFLFIVCLSAYLRDRTHGDYLDFSLYALAYAFTGIVLMSRILLQSEGSVHLVHRIFYIPVLATSVLAFRIVHRAFEENYPVLKWFERISFGAALFALPGFFSGTAFGASIVGDSGMRVPVYSFWLYPWVIVSLAGYFGAIVPATLIAWKSGQSRDTLRAVMGVHILALLTIVNTPAVVGYVVMPPMGFYFVPLLFLAHGLFRRDFNSFDDLLYRKGLLFYLFAFASCVVLFAGAAACLIFLRPDAGLAAYEHPYFLLPLFSVVSCLGLAVFIAGADPGSKRNLLIAGVLSMAGIFSVCMVIRALRLDPIVTRRLEQLCFIALVFSPSAGLRLAYELAQEERDSWIRITDAGACLLACIAPTDYFFGGYYDSPFLQMAALGPGVFVFFISSLPLLARAVFLLVRPAIAPHARLLIAGTLICGILMAANLPIGAGIGYYPPGNLQFIPALVFFFALYPRREFRRESTWISGKIARIAVTTLPLPFILLSALVMPSGKQGLLFGILVSTALALAAYILTFVVSRPVAVRIENQLLQIQQKAREAETERSRVTRLLGDLRSDLDMARRIQRRLLPAPEGSFSFGKYSLNYHPHGEVGGDICDIEEVRPGVVRAMLADATGHGVQAALVTTAIQALYSSLKYSDLDSAQILAELNRLYFDTFSALGVFFSAACLTIDSHRRELVFASAGHEEQFLLSDGSVRRLYTPNRLVGVALDSKFAALTLDLPQRGRLFLYSDGLSESTNDQNELFTVDRLELVLNSVSMGQPMSGLVLETVDSHRGARPLQDDLTILEIDFETT